MALSKLLSSPLIKNTAQKASSFVMNNHEDYGLLGKMANSKLRGTTLGKNASMLNDITEEAEILKKKLAPELHSLIENELSALSKNLSKDQLQTYNNQMKRIEMVLEQKGKYSSKNGDTSSNYYDDFMDGMSKVEIPNPNLPDIPKDKTSSDILKVAKQISKSISKSKVTGTASIPVMDKNGEESFGDKEAKEKESFALEQYQDKELDLKKEAKEEIKTNFDETNGILSKILKISEDSLKIQKDIENNSDGGGSLLDNLLDGKDGKGKKGRKGKGGGKLSKLAGGASKLAGSAGGLLKGAGSVLGKVALPLAAGMAIYDGVTGYNKASENLDLKGREATTGEKMSSAGGSIASGLSFGLLDEKSASKGIASFFGAGEEKKPSPVTSAIKPAPVPPKKAPDGTIIPSKDTPDIKSAVVVPSSITTDKVIINNKSADKLTDKTKIPTTPDKSTVDKGMSLPQPSMAVSTVGVASKLVSKPIDKPVASSNKPSEKNEMSMGNVALMAAFPVLGMLNGITGGGIGKMFTGLTNTISSGAKQAYSGIKKTASSVGKATESILKDTSKTTDKVTKKVGETTDKSLKGLEGFGKDTFGMMKSGLSGIMGGLSSIGSSVGGAISKAWTGVKNSSVGKAVSSAGSSVAEGAAALAKYTGVDKLSAFMRKEETGTTAGKYGAAKDIGDGAGVSFGAYQLTEKSGKVSNFLDQYAQKSGDKEAQKFADMTKKGKTSGADKEALAAYLKKVGDTDQGKAVQESMHQKEYLGPALALAKKNGITDQGAVAQIADMYVNGGPGGANGVIKRMKDSGDLSASGAAKARKGTYEAIIAKNPNKEKYRKTWMGRVDRNESAFKNSSPAELAVKKTEDEKAKNTDKKEAKEDIKTVKEKDKKVEAAKQATKTEVKKTKEDQTKQVAKTEVDQTKQVAKTEVKKTKDVAKTEVKKTKELVTTPVSDISSSKVESKSGKLTSSTAPKSNDDIIRSEGMDPATTNYDPKTKSLTKKTKEEKQEYNKANLAKISRIDNGLVSEMTPAEAKEELERQKALPEDQRRGAHRMKMMEARASEAQTNPIAPTKQKDGSVPASISNVIPVSKVASALPTPTKQEEPNAEVKHLKDQGITDPIVIAAATGVTPAQKSISKVQEPNIQPLKKEMSNNNQPTKVITNTKPSPKSGGSNNPPRYSISNKAVELLAMM